MRCWTCPKTAQAGHVLCRSCQEDSERRKASDMERLMDAVRFAERLRNGGAI